MWQRLHGFIWLIVSNSVIMKNRPLVSSLYSCFTHDKSALNSAIILFCSLFLTLTEMKDCVVMWECCVSLETFCNKCSSWIQLRASFNPSLDVFTSVTVDLWHYLELWIGCGSKMWDGWILCVSFVLVERLIALWEGQVFPSCCGASCPLHVEFWIFTHSWWNSLKQTDFNNIVILFSTAAVCQ